MASVALFFFCYTFFNMAIICHGSSDKALEQKNRSRYVWFRAPGRLI
jgi:hypothetical protein